MGGRGGDTTTILFCSQKGGILLTLQRFDENRWRPLTAFLLNVLDNVSSSGNGNKITAFSHGGSALKGTKVSNLYEHIKSTFLTCICLRRHLFRVTLQPEH